MPRSRSPWKARRVVVTAGPTREYFDAIRFLSNGSTGRMGIEIARAAARRGAHVTLVLGPTSLEPPAGMRVVPVVSTVDLLAATRDAVADADVAFFAAAPSDYRPRTRRKGKPAREGGEFALDLVPTRDVAMTLGRRKGRRVHVGFALEVARGEARARAKLERKRFDAIVWNGPENMGAGGGRVLWIERGAAPVRLPSANKSELARALLDRTAPLIP